MVVQFLTDMGSFWLSPGDVLVPKWVPWSYFYLGLSVFTLNSDR